ncbi:hypothetical protein EVAR_8596_1 [Eumeta japonica]|uniref:Uncharacterized protein n=1 Tax=Eumeta variegata TaxID=151549 RepID=A0A4C1XGN9_EUMVA|nr:hypothetical protein EVAR_8596_1 [Eumeta japonica]
MDTRYAGVFTSALAAFWKGIGYLMEEGVRHRNSHSLGKINGGSCYFTSVFRTSVVSLRSHRPQHDSTLYSLSNKDLYKTQKSSYRSYTWDRRADLIFFSSQI